MLLSYTIVDFNGAVDMQTCAPLTRSQCKVSDTQVTIRPVGLLYLLRVILSRFMFENSNGNLGRYFSCHPISLADFPMAHFIYFSC